MRTELSGLVKEGKTREDVIQYYVAKYGSQEPLARADRQGIQSARVVLPVRRRRVRRHRRSIRRPQMVAALAREPPVPPPARRRPPKTPPCRRASTASSKISISPLPPTQPTSDSLRPWQFFTLGALVCATAAVFIIRGTSAENLIFVCLAIFAAALVGLAALHALRPLATGETREPEMVGGHTRAAIEREKNMVLRSIKELEFDRAMGKLDEQDYEEMVRPLAIARRAADAAARQHEQRIPGADRTGARERGS